MAFDFSSVAIFSVTIALLQLSNAEFTADFQSWLDKTYGESTRNELNR